MIGGAGFIRRDAFLVRHLGIAGCLAIILGAKFWLIATHGSNVPLWDEWEGPRTLYLPWLNGTLTLGDLFSAHNEHRIFLTRIIHLALFALEGYWDPMAQVLVSATAHVTAIGALILMLSRGLDLIETLLLAAVATLFALPFGWANTLAGFQIQFYLLTLLGPLSLWVLYASKAFSPRWWLGTLLAVAAYFTIASGALTLLAFVALALLQFAFRQRRGWREILGIVAHVALAAVIIRDIPVIPDHAVLGPKTASAWFHAALVALSWPAAKTGWPPHMHAITVVAMWAPLAVLTVILLARAVPLRDPRWLVVAVAGWVILQLLVLVHGRGLQPLQSRYLDIHMLVPLVCAAALLSLRPSVPERWRTGGIVLASAWFLLILIGTAQKALGDLPVDLQGWRETSNGRTENVTRFLATGDFAALKDKPPFHIPYPSAEILRDTLSNPAVRAILPAQLKGEQAPRNRPKNATLHYGPFLLPIGFWLLLVAGLVASRRETPDVPG